MGGKKEGGRQRRAEDLSHSLQMESSPIIAVLFLHFLNIRPFRHLDLYPSWGPQ
jgi:hypothetical protein